MSAETTQQWLMSVCLTLALKWLVQDPLLIFVWSPLRAVIVRHREESKLAAIVHCCCTPFEHRKQHLKVQTVIELQTALRSLHNSILQHHVETALDQDEATSTSIRTNEQRVLVHSNSVRQQLRAKQEHQRLDLQRRRRQVSQVMAALIDGANQPVDVLTRVDLNTPTSTDASTVSRTDQDLQVEQLMQTYRRDAAKLVDQHESAQADARRKLAQRKLQKNRLRSRTSKVVRMNRILVVSQAEMEAGVDLSERSLIDDVLADEERRLAERIAAMELIMVSMILHSCMRAIYSRSISQAVASQKGLTCVRRVATSLPQLHIQTHHLSVVRSLGPVIPRRYVCIIDEHVSKLASPLCCVVVPCCCRHFAVVLLTCFCNAAADLAHAGAGSHTDG